MIGPFSTYAPPGVYVSTTYEPGQGQILDGLRVPVIIGTAQETLTQTDIEIIRGSSSVSDTPIYGEDPASNWVVGGNVKNPVIGVQNGSRTQFRVRNYPIVDGEGVGRVTNDVTKVSVTINGSQAVISSVDGNNGIVTLLIPPSAEDVVLVNYYFRRTDTRIVDDLSNQVTSGIAYLVSPKSEVYEVTSGVNDVFVVYPNDSTDPISITFSPGTKSASDIATEINAASIPDFSAQTYSDNEGLVKVRLNSTYNIRIGSGTANGVLGFNPGDVTGRNRIFRTYQRPIVDGSDGGMTTTEVSRVVVLVDGIQVIPQDLDGNNGIVTLRQAPRSGAIVTIEYWFNTFQDTFDYLPNNNITSVSNVGISPGRRDFNNNTDFVIENKGDQSMIQWGTAFRVEAGENTGGVDFDGTQIVGLLVDDRIYNVELTRYSDPVTNSVSTNKFVLPLVATTGNGRDTPLDTSTYNSVTNGRIDLRTNRPDLIIVRAGNDIRDAMSKPPISVIEVDSTTNVIKLKSSVPADQKAFATFWYNRIVDDTYTFNVLTPGSSGNGTYTVTSYVNDAPLYQTKFGMKAALPQTVQWPSGVESMPDAFHYGGSPVSETVTVSFDNALFPATHGTFVNSGPSPYDLYTASRIFGGVVVDGNAPVSVDLSTAFNAVVMGLPVSSGALSFLSTDRLVLEIDGVSITVNVSAATSLATVVTAINAAVDASTTVHADGSVTFLSTAPNNLASVVTYGSESLLRIEGRNVPSLANGLVSSVKILTPVVGGQTNAASKLGLNTNVETLGSYDALNKAASLLSSQTAPFVITAGVDDSMLFNLDSQDVNSVLPSGTAVSAERVVDAINTSWLRTAGTSVASQALTQALAVANEIRSDYNNHISNAGGIFHTSADVTNAVTAAVATDLPTLLVLVNEIKADINAHIASTVYHLVVDGVNPITSGTAVDLITALVLISEIKNNLNRHYTQSGIHALNDLSNSVALSLTSFVAFIGTGVNLGKIELRSRVSNSNSIVQISSLGSANSVLGFTSGDRALRSQPTASLIASALNSNSAFAALAVAGWISSPGLGQFLVIRSLTTGSTSTVSFTSVANTAFTTDTGIGIVPGTSGDIGEAGKSGFSVTSSNPSGSNGIGIPGQTYTDQTTGLRFTILPAEAGDYASGGSFQLLVNSTFKADGGIPTKSIPGVEVTVYNTNNMIEDTTGLLTTFKKSGNEPAIGDVYNISYNYAKSDLNTGLFRDLRTIQANFGPPTPEYPLSLAARLALLNGAVVLGLKQVQNPSGTSAGLTNAFINAIDEQRKPIEGSIKPDIIAPLSTDPSVYSFLDQHCVFMGSPRQEGERMGTVGVGAGVTPQAVRSIASSLKSELMIVNYPDAYVVAVTDDQGNSSNRVVDGTYMAAALAGASCNPSIDVATPWTRREVMGFQRLARVLDPTEANQVAVSGVTVMESHNSSIRVRHGLTTNLESVITRTPSVVMTIQYIQQSIRRVLDPYIGQKFTGSLIKAIENSLNGMFSSLIDQKIVTTVSSITVYSDSNDPTVMRVEAIYVPVFPLEYIVTKLQVRVRV